MNSIEAQKQRLFELIADFEAAMLVVDHPAGQPLVRPVRVIDITADGQAVLATWNLPELAVIDDGAAVLLLFQGRNRNRFAWMRGPAIVERRRDEIERCWDEAWRDWFQSGPENSALCLVVVSGAEGEYWDRREPGGLAEVLARARSLIVGGSTMEPSPPHGKVKLACRMPRPARCGSPRRADPMPAEEADARPAEEPAVEASNHMPTEQRFGERNQ